MHDPLFFFYYYSYVIFAYTYIWLRKTFVNKESIIRSHLFLQADTEKKFDIINSGISFYSVHTVYAHARAHIHTRARVYTYIWKLTAISERQKISIHFLTPGGWIYNGDGFCTKLHCHYRKRPYSYQMKPDLRESSQTWQHII